jgi:prolipoprotein diacylglyceryltransferase
MMPELHAALPAGFRLTVGLHPLATLVAVLAATLFVWRRTGDAGLAWLAPLAAVVVLGGARAFYWLVDGGGWLASGGLASMGGVVAGLAAARPLARLARLPAAALLDALVPAALLALALGRVGCFFGGCCYGAPTALPWGIVFPHLGGPPRHPLQLYSAAIDLAIVAAVCRRPAAPGVTAARALAAFATARFALETLRDVATTDVVPQLGLTVPQALCGLLLLGVRSWLRRSDGGLSGPGAHGTVPRRMRPAALLLLLSALGAVRPVAAIDADFSGTLAVRPARGTLDVATGAGGLAVKRWRFTPAPASDGIDPVSEPIVLSLATDEVALPAGSVQEVAPGRRWTFRDDAATRGFTRLKLKRRADGVWLVGFRAAGLDLTRLVNQYPLCEGLAFAIGNDEGASGVDLDRPRGAASPRIKLRGFCELECPPALAAGVAIGPRHVICPN